jgi:hypothetical protein
MLAVDGATQTGTAGDAATKIVMCGDAATDF